MYSFVRRNGFMKIFTWNLVNRLNIVNGFRYLEINLTAYVRCILSVHLFTKVGYTWVHLTAVYCIVLSSQSLSYDYLVIYFEMVNNINIFWLYSKVQWKWHVRCVMWYVLFISRLSTTQERPALLMDGEKVLNLFE